MTATAPSRFPRLAIIVGAALGAALPFVVGGASVPFFTDVEARIGFALRAAAVNAMFGAVVGWAVGALIVRARSRRQRPDA